MVKRYDLHPNIASQSVVQTVADTATEEEFLVFESVPVGKNKVLVAELLKVDITINMSTSTTSREYIASLKESITQVNLCRRHARIQALSASGHIRNENRVFDLTDGVGNGIIIAKNPIIRLDSSGVGVPASAVFRLYWRYKEVSQSELIQMLGGV